MSMEITNIIDTREKAYVNERLVGIPGTGRSEPCDLCQTPHEIHVHVKLDDGTFMNVGEGCGRKTWGDFSAAMARYEIASLNLPYKFIGKGIHNGQRTYQFEINGKFFSIKGKSEKDAVMYVFKREFKGLKKDFSTYFRLKKKIEG